MKLLYLYIGYMSRPLDYHEISFSNDYHVHYERDSKKLYIKKNLSERISVYGDKILDLKLIVGKNGCGKSTVLDLLGFTAQDLRREFPQYDRENEPWPEEARDWFALYHLKDDLFALEGYNPYIFSEMSVLYLNTHYSIAFQYDFHTNTLNIQGYLQDFPKEKTGPRYINQFSYLTYRLEPDVPWYFRHKRQKYEKYNNTFFERYDISQYNYYSIEYFLYLAATNERDFRMLFDNDPAALKVEIGLERVESLLLEKASLAEAIYGEGQSFLPVSMPQLEKMFGDRSELNYKHSMIIRYLEVLLVYSLSEETVKNNKKFTVRDDAEETKYVLRRDFLLDFIKQLTHAPAKSEAYKETIMHSYDLRLAKRFCAALEQIPDEFFKSGERAEIRLKDCETNFLEELMKCYDENQENEEHEINHRSFLSFTVENLSTGELALIDLYAAILNGVQGWNQQKKNLILLLDEPDSRLHPEWARLFLKRLVSLFETDPFSGHRFQIIITTHSPLLLSDVPREDIICLQQTDNGIDIKDAQYGFMSNLNDILLDSMFLKSPFGAFAEQYTNKLVEQIAGLKKACEESNETIDNLELQIKDLRKRIKIIDDPYISKALQNSLNSLEHTYHMQLPPKERIAYLEKELERLKAMERDTKND